MRTKRIGNCVGNHSRGSSCHFHFHSHQSGVTLISTMIGLLLGLFAVLAMMTAYKTQVTQAITTRSSSSIDGQVAAALAVTQLEVQRAGFGVEAVSSCLDQVGPPAVQVAGPAGAANTDLVLLTGAALSGNTLSGTASTIGAVGAAAVTGNAFIWRAVDTAGASTCGGLVSVGGGLKLLPVVTCTDASEWSSRTWTASSVQDIVTPGTLSASGKAVSFSTRLVASCSPFGRGTASTGLEFTVSAGQSMNKIVSSAVSCIPNICK